LPQFRIARPLLPFVILVIALVAIPRLARADKVDRFIEQLSTSSDYKVRLSAALNLAKISDPRAVPSFVKALKDSDKTVRGVAAAALGKQVTAETPAKVRDKVLAALKETASKDSNDFVRKQAQKAYDALKSLTGGGSVAKGGIYVNIGSMSAKSGDAAAMKALMRKTVLKTFKGKASSMKVEWPGGKDPTAKQLSAKKVTAFHVDGTLNELTVSGTGSSTMVSCKVSMLLATYPEKSMFGFLKGGAQVQGGGSATDLRYAQEDCVSAVIEDLIARKIIPTIQARVP
jgi:hypothetical protein